MVGVSLGTKVDLLIKLIREKEQLANGNEQHKNAILC